MLSFKESSASLLFALVLTPVTVHAQTATPPDKLPAFEVATIKPVDMSHRSPGTNVYPGGRLRINSIPLKTLICTAFHIGYWQLSGGEDWMNDEYDIQAKPADTTPPTTYNLRHSNYGIEDERLRQMLQALLIDRFQLKFHRETTTGLVFVLEKSGKPIPLVPTTEKYAKNYGEGYGGEVAFAGNKLGLYNTSMPQLAWFAGNIILHHPVLDHTGLDGSFDFTRQIVSVSDDPPSGTNYEDKFQLFIQEIGLKLTKSTGPVDTFVIDHAEKPSPN